MDVHGFTGPVSGPCRKPEMFAAMPSGTCGERSEAVDLLIYLRDFYSRI